MQKSLLPQLWCISILALFSSLAVTTLVQWPKELENSSTTFDHDDFSSRLPRRELWGLRKKGQFQFISNNKLGPPPESLEYQSDSSGGKDVTIYIIDSGFAGYEKTAELLPDGRNVTHYQVPRDKYPSLDPGWSYIDWDQETHGVDCAVAAGGKQSGISPNANLELIQVGRYIHSGNHIQLGTWPAVLEAVSNYTLGRMSKWAESGYRKSVVTMSVGFAREINSPEVDNKRNAFWTKFLNDLDEQGAAFFTPAGNGGLDPQQNTLADYHPTCLGTPDNNLITVGGVYADGTFWPNTTRESPEGGSISLFAPVTHLVGTRGGNDYTKDFIGHTSIGTAIAAGLGAYFLGIDATSYAAELKDIEENNEDIDYQDDDEDEEYLDAIKLYSLLDKELYEDGVPKAMKLKRYMTEKASFQRSTQILAHYPIQKAGNFLPKRLNAIYNMGRGPPPGADLDSLCVYN